MRPGRLTLCSLAAVVAASVAGCGSQQTDSIVTHAQHGVVVTLRSAPTSDDRELVPSAQRAVVRAFAASVYTSELQRIRVRSEDKEAIAAFHWRGAPDEETAERAVQEIARRAEEEGLTVHWGRKVLEVRPPVVLDKGLGIAALLRGTDVSAAMYVGDDTTDLDAFRGLRTMVSAGELACAVCVAVSSDEAPPGLALEADLTVDGPGGVRELLEALL